MSLPAAAEKTVAAIEIDHVSMGFKLPHKADKYWALREVSLQILEGETIGVIGRNGAGKTTLLQLLAGIIEPTSGSIRRHGKSISLLSLNAGLQPNLSGRDNAILNGLLLGLSLSQIRAKLAAVREFSELGDFFEMPVATYSTGMRARLGFSTAHLADPDVLLIDEVLAVGDRGFRVKALGVMEDRAHSDRTIVLVSHSHGVVRRLCDRVAWIERGKLRAIGETETVLDGYEQA